MTGPPKLSGKHRVVALDGSLREGLSGDRVDGNDLVLEKKMHNPADVSSPRSAPNRGSTVIDFHKGWLFEAFKKTARLVDKRLCRLPFHPLVVAKPGGLLEAKAYEKGSLRPSSDTYWPTVSLHYPATQALVNRVFRVAQIGGCSTMVSFLGRLREPQIRHHLPYRPQRWRRLLRPPPPPLKLNGRSSCVKLSRLLTQIAMNCSNLLFCLRAPASPLALGPATPVSFHVLSLRLCPPDHGVLTHP